MNSQNPPKRAILLIDGSNFYFKLSDLDLSDQLHFNFAAFAETLANGYQLVECIYYIGKIRTDGSPKVQKLFNQQRRLLAHLKKHNFVYSLGYLLKDGKGKHSEKGVDVKMAVDMLSASYENKADKIILVSSDSDLIPAIKQARAKHKEVEYIGFSHQPSIALVANCTTSRLLTKSDLEKFKLEEVSE